MNTIFFRYANKVMRDSTDVHCWILTPSSLLCFILFRSCGNLIQVFFSVFDLEIYICVPTGMVVGAQWGVA